jgi:hypothetical protein
VSFGNGMAGPTMRELPGSKPPTGVFAAVENGEQLVGDPGEWHLTIVEHFAQQRARNVIS